MNNHIAFTREMEKDGAIYEEDDKGEMMIVKSSHASTISKVRFLNESRSRVAVYWLDYAGRMVLYRKLDPGQFVDLNTYLTHPWIFKDCLTGEMLSVHKNPIFRPGPNRLQFVAELRTSVVVRNVVRITMPVRSLRMLAIVAIVSVLVQNGVSSGSRLSQFDLPLTLERELESWLRICNRNKTNDT